MAYAGDLDCQKCWQMLAAETSAQLVDVRTAAEWNFVGMPDVSALGREAILVEWQRYPDMSVNPAFVASVTAELEKRGIARDAAVLFICRSGARSQSAAAAMSAAGYLRSYNVAGGFEGGRDDAGHRSSVEGWKFDGLPWLQR